MTFLIPFIIGQVSSTFYFKLLFVICNGYFCVNGVEGLFTMYFAASTGAIWWEDIPMYRSDRLLLYIESMYNTQPTSFYCVWNSTVYCTILYQGKSILMYYSTTIGAYGDVWCMHWEYYGCIYSKWPLQIRMWQDPNRAFVFLFTFRYPCGLYAEYCLVVDRSMCNFSELLQ